MKISVVIPVYNGEHFIVRCIESLFKQTFKDFEIIVVNDGSCDNTEKELKKIINKDSIHQITYIYQENSGVTKARETGTFLAQGDFITFVDADDTLPPLALEYLAKAQEKNKTEITIGSILKGTDCILTKEEYIKSLFKDVDLMGPCAKLIKRELINKEIFQIPRQIVKGEDFIMNILIAQNTSTSITRIKEIVYNYNKDNSNSALHVFKPTVAYEARVYNLLFETSKPEYLELIRKESINSRMNEIENIIIRKDCEKVDRKSLYIAELIQDIKRYNTNKISLVILRFPNNPITKLLIKVYRKLYK